MAKTVVAQIKLQNLKSIGSALESELKSAPYEGNCWYEKGTFYIRGRSQIEQFVKAMMAEIEKCREVFKDAESIAEFEHDENFLKSLLKIKAS
jgi:hypothetical protein